MTIINLYHSTVSDSKRINEKQTYELRKLFNEFLEDKSRLLSSLGINISVVELYVYKIDEMREYESKWEKYFNDGEDVDYIVQCFDKSKLPNKDNPFLVSLSSWRDDNYNRYETVNIHYNIVDLIDQPDSIVTSIYEVDSMELRPVVLPENFDKLTLDDRIAEMYKINNQLGLWYQEMIDYVFEMNIKSFQFDW